MPLEPFDFGEPLVLPIGGKSYTIPPIGWNEGLRLAAAMQGGGAGILTADYPSEYLFRLAMGGTWDEGTQKVVGGVWEEMLADRVPFEALFRSGLTSVIEALDGREAAETMWKSGINPEAVAAAVTAATQGSSSTRSRSTASASATRSQASTTSTTSRTGTRPRKAATKPASRSNGRRSSSSGG